MRKHYVKHENLRRYLDEFERNEGEVSDESFKNLIGELKHSHMIIAGDIDGTVNQFLAADIEGTKLGFLFTDMDEYRKFIPNAECGAADFDFEFYKAMVEKGDVDGFVINPAAEAFTVPGEIFRLMVDFPQHFYPPLNSYTTDELKDLKDSIDNTSLERFINDSSNIAMYEELFREISNSTLLTLMVSGEDYTHLAQNGVITMKKEPKGFLYLDEIGGKYATVYTSEDRINNVDTSLNKYSQIVNFSQLANYILNDDLDGIIINPNCENVMITREVLMEYWMMLEDVCNDERLNSAIMHMFIISDESDSNGAVL